MARPAMAYENNGGPAQYRPTRYGVSLLVGNAYDPDNFGLVILQGQMLVDYERVFWHSAPESLALKFEANVGMTTDGRDKSLAALNMLAFYRFEEATTGKWTPYIEAGIGVIYTDFRVDGQGLYFNFNPQAGFGFEYDLGSDKAMTMALRLHHLSNGNTYKENRGINSALLMIGYLF